MEGTIQQREELIAYPSISHPWYLIQRKQDRQMMYYTFQLEGSHEFTDKKSQAMIFTNLTFAARVALVENSEIRVLVTKEDAIEFGREISSM